MIGCGGVARAVAVGIFNEGGKLIVADVNKSKAKSFAREFNCEFIAIEEIKKLDCDLLINATPVGMFPDVDKMPVDEGFLKKGMAVFDVVYNPVETKLLKMAKKKGCKIISGVDMFIYQAVEQFELWTGKKAPVELMEEIITRN